MPSCHHQEEDVVESERRVVDPVDEAERERDRDRVVEARLALERPGEATPHVRVAERREDCRRVGRRDDAAEQDRLGPVEVEEGVRRRAGEERGDDDPDGAQKRCRNGDVAEAAPRGREAALVEDRDEADDADLARQLGVVELDPAGAVRPEQHPEGEEGDERRHACARRAEADGDAGGQHGADEQEHGALVHACHSRGRPAGPRRSR